MNDEIALELDCREMRCPMPVIELGRHIEDILVGELILIVTEDPAARVDVAAWCRLRDQEYVGEQAAADGLAGYLVRRIH